MKIKRLLFLVMAICLASSVKAQFYDTPEDIFFYLEESVNGNPVSNKYVMVFNFDGRRAGLLMHESVNNVKKHLNENPDYYLEKEETCNYSYEYVSSSSSGTYYKCQSSTKIPGGTTWFSKYTAQFSSDRNTLTLIDETKTPGGQKTKKTVLRKVDKSYFKIGRSRTPSGTLYE